MKSANPEKLGTVWVAKATLWVIDASGDIPIRKRIGVAIDTPIHVAAKVANLRRDGHKSIWSTGDASGKQYHG